MKRNLQTKLDALLDIFPAVLILGVRQSGKTTLSQQARPKWKYFDLENTKDHDFISRDMDFFFKEYSGQIIIDEAQEYPAIFKQLRGVIDSDREHKNRFILTGSSSPELIQHASDSLAGRIGIIELGTLKMNEVNSVPLSSFYEIFNSEVTNKTITSLKNMTSVDQSKDPIHSFLYGGYPEPVMAKNETYHSQWMENYFQLYINRDIKKLYPKLDTVKFRRFISTLSELSGTIINKAQLGRSLDVSEVTARDYLEIAHKTFIWRLIPSYENTASKSIVKMPKGILRDSGLTHFLSNIDSREKLLRSPHVGQNFEAFVIEEIIKGIQCTTATNWNYFYYRTKHGVEVDLILEGNFGVVPVEIKFGSNTSSKDLTSLQKFIKDNDLPLGIVINNSSEIAEISPQIIQVPVGMI
ncbi:MAG: ATP-binding protein [Bdellovibrionaceae bacterium]|nr:ATP-binding protein [Pseudobdellovibrionaceae bacterium]